MSNYFILFQVIRRIIYRLLFYARNLYVCMYVYIYIYNYYGKMIKEPFTIYSLSTSELLVGVFSTSLSPEGHTSHQRRQHASEQYRSSSEHHKIHVLSSQEDQWKHRQERHEENDRHARANERRSDGEDLNAAR